MIHVWMLLLLFSVSAYSADFQHIKLSPQFADYLNRPKLKSMTKSSMAEGPGLDFSQTVRTKLLGGNGATQVKDFTSPFPTEGEESPLFEEIRSHLEASHRQIGLREVTQLDFLNRQFNMGQENFSGFSWQKPYGVVHVFADRQVTPNLFGDNWLIQDTFTFDIEATSFLESTNEAGITNMSEMEIGAFAGITFKRVYTYYHYANSYQEGLKADFSKLFLPFVKINPNAIGRMGHEEIVKREDNWTASVGGLITTPPLYNFSLSAGILAQFAYQQMVAVQNTENQDQSADKILLSVKSKKAASTGANVSLQLDFFKILKLTILNYDLTYEYASAKEFTLGLNPEEWRQVVNDQNQGQELRRILQGMGQVRALGPYVVQLDEEDSSSLAQRGSLLVWGRLQKSKTEQIRVIKDNVVKVFYKNYAQSMRVVQNLFSRLFSAVVYKLLKLPMGTKNAALYNRQLTMEYEATHPQAADPEIARIDSSEQFSFVLNQSYEAAKTHRWIDQKFKNDVIWFVDSFTTLPKDYKAIIRSEQLKGPMIVESNLRVEKAGFDYIVNQSEDDVFGHVAQVCGSRRVSEWMKEKSREKFLKRLQTGAESCVKTIGKRYLAFKSDYQENALKPSLGKFKSFLTKYFKKAESLQDLAVLFGEENIFINGTLKATTSQNTQFVTSFSSGQFRGLGVIDNFKRANGSRLPASIVSE